MRRAAAGLLTPGGSEGVRIQLAVAAKVARASGVGGSGGGGSGGVRSCRLQCDKNADAGEGTRPSCKGTPLANSTCIPVLTLWAEENMQDVLRNVALPTLGISVWCKRWHRGGHCFTTCEQKGIHISPTAATLATVTAAL